MLIGQDANDLAVSCPQDFSYASLAVRSEHSHGHHEKEDSPFTLLTKFIVRPSIAKEFIGAWLKVRLTLT